MFALISFDLVSAHMLCESWLVILSLSNQAVQLRESNLDIVVGKISEYGYAVQCFKLNSNKFGLPQNRNRVYIVAVKLSMLGKTPDAFFACFKSCLSRCQIPLPHLETCLNWGWASNLLRKCSQRSSAPRKHACLILRFCMVLTCLRGRLGVQSIFKVLPFRSKISSCYVKASGSELTSHRGPGSIYVWPSRGP